jgi:Sulfotransferase family
MNVRVLYFAGVSYTGTTLLANALGQVSGFFYGGELRNIWHRGLVENRTCACGVPFSRCPVWAEILTAAFDGEAPDAHALGRVEKDQNRTRNLAQLALTGSVPTVSHPGIRSEYADAVGRLYRSIRTTQECRVVVDSSKSPAHAHFLDSLPDVDVYLVHLLRDPRGNAYSLLRRNAHSPRLIARGALVWSAWHVAAERIWARKPGRYLRVRYEEFAANPRHVIRRILTMLDEEEASLQFISDGAIHLEQNHTFSANRMRFQSGRIEVRPDVEWREKLALQDRVLVTSLTLPVLLHYHYPVFA